MQSNKGEQLLGVCDRLLAPGRGRILVRLPGKQLGFIKDTALPLHDRQSTLRVGRLAVVTKFHPDCAGSLKALSRLMPPAMMARHDGQVPEGCTFQSQSPYSLSGDTGL